jgi:hypothetical protein
MTLIELLYMLLVGARRSRLAGIIAPLGCEMQATPAVSTPPGLPVPSWLETP